jgi:membrane-bound serine protease (ClpP class)
MRNVYLIVIILMLAATAVCAENAIVSADSNQPKTVKAVIISCHDMIDEGLYKSIKRRTEMALAGGCEYIIYDIDTYGGDLFAAFDISNYFLHDLKDKVVTVAYVSKKAISAGAMISVGCKEIIMKENASIGDCAPIVMGGKLEGVEREKVETVTRAAFKNSAQSYGYPEPLLKAMVTMQIEVYKVKNLKTGKLEFFEANYVPTDANEYDIQNKSDELLTLTSAEALEYGISKAVVKNVDEVLSFLAKRDNIVFEKPIPTLEPIWSEQMVRWLNSPAVTSVLVMIAMLGIYIEFKTPGVWLPALIAGACILIIIGSKYLTGMANWIEIAMFIVGIVLLGVELFVIPGFGIIGFAGVALIFVGLFGMLIKNPPDKLPWPETEMDWSLFSTGILSIVYGFAGFIAAALVIAKVLPKTKFASGLVLSEHIDGAKLKISMTGPVEQQVKIGDAGVVISTLRPVGKAQFGQTMVECMAEGEFLDKGSFVRIIDIRGNTVVVRKEKT